MIVDWHLIFWLSTASIQWARCSCSIIYPSIFFVLLYYFTSSTLFVLPPTSLELFGGSLFNFRLHAAPVCYGGLAARAALNILVCDRMLLDLADAVDSLLVQHYIFSTFVCPDYFPSSTCLFVFS
ncbi:hypothetical protein EDB19DRAFT_1201472 [Suillus lakei]|nr:hypothetical protein EDB19DRAFT_1201472 [Suillus lakei]